MQQSHLWQLWRLNSRLGWPERARGLHYWLGYEYALALRQLRLPAEASILDVGTGGYSTFPYMLPHLLDVNVVALDIAPELARQRQIRQRAIEAGLCRRGQVRLVRADGRRLPFPPRRFDTVSAISTLEHVRGLAGDRQTLQHIARVLRPDGKAVVTLPFRAYGSVQELELYRRHYSPKTLWSSLLEPSGLQEERRIYYGERVPFYAFYHRLPSALTWLHRPWDTLLTRLFLREVQDPAGADAVLVVLKKQAQTVP